jgi:hypothetical protein
MDFIVWNELKRLTNTAQGRAFMNIVMAWPLFRKLAATMLVTTAYYKYIKIILKWTQDYQNCSDRGE